MTTLETLRACLLLAALMCAGCGPDLNEHVALCRGDVTVTLSHEPWGNGAYVACHETKAQRDAAIAREEGT